MSIAIRDKNGNRKEVAGVGLPGPAGKSAYQYAVEGGFTGTEAEFAALQGRMSNPNLLDNWYLVDPINQRGKTEYTAGGYTIDRWHLATGSFTVTEQGLRISTGEFLLNTKFPASLILGKIVTISILSSDNELAYGVVDVPSVLNGVYDSVEVPLSKGVNIDIWANNDVVAFRILGVIQEQKTIKAVKLELGSVQTLAHKDENGSWVLNDPPPNKATELAKCQRYYLHNVGNLASGYRSGPYCSLFIPTPVTMRATPSVSITYADNIVDSNGGIYQIIDVANGTFVVNNGVHIEVTTAAPNDGVFATACNASTSFDLDANL